MDKDTAIFKRKSLSDIFNEIYKNTKGKERQINSLIAELKPLIKNVNDATIIVPLIKEYLEIGTKNDEHVVKMAAIIQRLIASTNKGKSKENVPEDIDDFLTDDEINKIKEEAIESKEELNSLKEEESDSEKNDQSNTNKNSE